MGKIINIEIDIEALGKGLFDLYEECEDYLCETNLTSEIRNRLKQCMRGEIEAELVASGLYETIDGLYEYYKPYMEKYLAEQDLKIIDNYDE